MHSKKSTISHRSDETGADTPAPMRESQEAQHMLLPDWKKTSEEKGILDLGFQGQTRN